MFVIDRLIAALAFTGRHGAAAVALSIVCGLAVQPLAAVFKPWLGETIFIMLTLAFLRVEPAALGALWRRPALVLAAAAWAMLIVPAALAVLFLGVGVDVSMPGLFFILVLQACAPPLTSAPALAAVMGLDVALTLAGLVACTLVAPLVAAIYTHALLGVSQFDPAIFGLRLGIFMAGAAAAAAAIRYAAGGERITRHREKIDGLSVVAMFIFAAAAMEGITGRFIAQPLLVLALLALTFALALALIGITALVFLPAGRQRALAIGLISGNRNIGVMLAATGFAVPELAWLYFGLAQFPIYLLPVMLKPLAQKLAEKR